MPVKFIFTPKLNLLYYAGFGFCTADQFFDAVRQTIQLELKQNRLRVIFDVKSTKEVDFGAKDFKRAAEIISMLKKHNLVFEKTAVLSMSDVAENFINALSLFLTDYPIKIKLFKYPEEAVTWLGLSGDENEVLEINRNLHQEFKIQPEQNL